MKTILLILLIGLLVSSDPSLLQGKWQLKSYGAMLTFIQSDRFKNESETKQQEMIESIQFALDNTSYEFRKDSIFFSDAGANIIKSKKGKWLFKSDTIFIFESGKVNVLKFFADKLSKDELHLKFVRPDGSVGKSALLFEKVHGE